MTVSVAVTTIMQGDEYPIPVYVKIDGSVATPENIDALRVKIGPYTATWPDGAITEQNGVWLFPMTQEQSYAMAPGLMSVQAQVKKGGFIVGTAETAVNVGKSVLKGAW